MTEEIKTTTPPNLPPSVKLRHTLRGHTGTIGRIAWSPDGRMLASPSWDKTIRLWEVGTGKLLRALKGHEEAVNSVVFDPTGRILASGSDDSTIKLWQANSSKPLRTLAAHQNAVVSVSFNPTGSILASGSEDHTIKLWDMVSGTLLDTIREHNAAVYCVSFDPMGDFLASGSEDHTIKLWRVPSGKKFRTFKGHKSIVYCVAFDSAGRTLASVSDDETIKLWTCKGGIPKLSRTLEGHIDEILCVGFFADDRLLASKGGHGDDRVLVWRCDTWEPVVTIPAPTSPYFLSSLAFHPTLPLLATVGSEPNAPKEARDTLIHIWELDLDVLLGKAGVVKGAPRAVHHTTAKIVLVGDSGVGKTALGWKLVHGEYKDHSSTHGQQFWVLNQLCTRRSDGTECEAILWDLAGQPDYRLIHALFLDDADLALVLFDPTDSRDPLHGVEFWLKQLKAAQASSQQSSGNRQDACATILVAARADRGAPTLTPEELKAFCEQRGIKGYLSTSAKEGEGLEELIERMKAQIPWEEKSATVTTVTFKRIKDYVLILKENRQEKQVIVSPQELRQRLEQTDAGWQFTDAEMMTAVGHLENYGYVKRLRTSKGEQRILLAPELLNNLAASFVLEARRNPKGLGSLEEKRLLSGEYAFRELEKLSSEERSILLDSAALLFLEHHVCFRETDPLNGQSYLVFPELINLKKPALENEAATENGTAYTVSGAVENVYASLVVLLGYTHTFTRTDQWHNQARYEVTGGMVSGFRQEAERDGELDFVLYFSADIDRPVTTLFQSLFESFLARRNLTVFRYEPVVCTKCGHRLDRAVLRARSREGKKFAYCSECGKKLTLPKMEEPIQLTRQQQEEVEAQRRVADLRTRFEQAVFRVQAYVQEQKIKAPECFISYAWGEAEHERWVEKRLATDLQKAGINVILDRWENAKIGASVSRFIERTERCDRIIVVGTPLYRLKYENKDTKTGYVVAAEVDLIANRLMDTEAQKETVLPVLLAGEKTAALPPLLHGRVYADFRNERDYFKTAFDLILSLYNIAVTDRAVVDLRESLREVEMR